jgi:signal transduction histidine kinase
MVDAPISGAGLGLSVARRIIEGHGGDITVQSAPGQGSVFRLRLLRACTGAALPIEAEGRPGVAGTSVP